MVWVIEIFFKLCLVYHHYNDIVIVLSFTKTPKLRPETQLTALTFTSNTNSFAVPLNQCLFNTRPNKTSLICV